jgi:acyl-CoA reductase-like NAD-dependent aldehyde dehydrogenase
VAGNLRAADFVLRVIDKRAKLLGLDAPLKVQAEVVTYDGTDLDREVERVARLIEAGTIAINDIATITELTDQGEPLGVEEQTGAEGTTTA